jgi:hypothetical protein
MAIGMTIGQFTQRTPMTILDILEALAFTTGHALAQKEARKSLPFNLQNTKTLRDYTIAALDKGIDEGSVDRTQPQLFIPPTKGVN